MNAFLLTVARMTVVLGAALVLMPILRQRSAAMRASVLTSALGCAAVVPVLQAVVPAWGVPLHPATALAGSDLPMGLLVAAWAIGAAIHLFVLVIGMVRLMGVAAGANPIRDGACADLALDLAAEYRVHAPVLLLEAERATLPVTWGHAQPKILLPPSAREWPEDRLRIVLRHELAHVQRRDWLVQVLAIIVRSLYWFHPLVWLACARLRLETERACDDAVLRSGVTGAQYAGHLLDLARRFVHGREPSYAAQLAGRSTLERRVRAMLAFGADRSPSTRSRSAVVAATMLFLAVATAGFGSAAEIVAIVKMPPPHRLTLLLDGRIVDLSKGWPPYPDPRAGVVAGVAFQSPLQNHASSLR